MSISAFTVTLIIAIALGSKAVLGVKANREGEGETQKGRDSEETSWEAEGTVTNTLHGRGLTSFESSLPYVSRYEIVQTFPHDEKAFTQGLVFDPAGTLYESDGLFGKSGVRAVDVRTGSTLRWTANERNMFGEGVEVIGNKLIQLTWKNNVINEYELPSLKLLNKNVKFIGREGWGLAANADRTTLYLTDSTDMLFHVNPKTYEVTKRLKIVDKRITSQSGSPKAIHGVNELEYVNGELWGNIYPMYQGKHSECVVRVHPETGEVIGWIDMHGLLSQQSEAVRRSPHNYVLNGIAYHEQTDRLYVTGKQWNHLYQIRIKAAHEISTPEHVTSVCNLG